MPDRLSFPRASFLREEARFRFSAILLALIIHIGAIWMLVIALSANFASIRLNQPGAPMVMPFSIDRPLHPPPSKPAHNGGKPDRGAPAAKFRLSHAAPVFAVPQPVPQVPPRHASAQPAAGSSQLDGGDVSGGSSAGITGVGEGEGSGGKGGGTGQGEGSGGGGSDPEWLSGRIRDRDYPESARRAGSGGTTRTEITIGRDGRPLDCVIRHSSGSGELDQATCSLIMQRFRFRPARDATGRAVVDSVYYEQEWEAQPLQADE